MYVPLCLCAHQVRNIVDKATKELSMEKTLREMDSTWAGMEFESEEHPRTGVKLLKSSEELIETLEDNQVQSSIYWGGGGGEIPPKHSSSPPPPPSKFLPSESRHD